METWMRSFDSRWSLINADGIFLFAFRLEKLIMFFDLILDLKCGRRWFVFGLNEMWMISLDLCLIET